MMSRRDALKAAAGTIAAGALTPSAALAAASAVPATPDAALTKLLNGNKRFARDETLQPRRELARLRRLAQDQKPFAALLGCADSRVPMEIVFDQGFGDIFVVRVAGNIATPVEIASLEYATALLGVKVIMVLGHSNCGAVKAALGGGEVPGQISTLYQYIVPGIDRNDTLPNAIKANVRFQVGKLGDASPVIASAVKSGSLKLAGGVFDLKSGKVSSVAI